MLAEGRTGRTAVAALGLLVLLLLAMVVALAGVSRGDSPVFTTNPNASRTASWFMNTSAGLSPSGIAFTSGHAKLPWIANNVSWSTPDSFTSNGTLDANATVVGGGIGLRADPSNHVANPGFDDASAWTYGNGTKGLLNATWNASTRAGSFWYVSPASRSLWAAMDSLTGWAAVGFGDTVSATLNSSVRKQGTASAQLAVSFTGSNGDYASLQNQSTNVDWSAVNRLVLWVYLNLSAPVTFNVSALDASFVTHYTSPQALAAGWNEVTVDLNQLGSASVRTHLAFISLRLSSTSKLARTVLFDDLRTGTAKEFTDGAYILQEVTKVNVTDAALGSAQLGLWWQPTNASNVTSYGLVRVTGPGGTYQHALPTVPSGDWTPFVADISSTVTAAGMYTVNVTVSLSVNTTAPCNLTALVDNVSLLFPNRHNATYSSKTIPLGNDSVFDGLSWAAELPAGTSASLSLRIQRNSPLPDAWGPWTTWPSPGAASLEGETGVGFQVRVALNTTNASVSPVLESLWVTSHHRALSGSVVGGPWSATTVGFLWWSNLTTSVSAPAGTAVQFYVGDNRSWIPVSPGGSLRWSFTNTTIYWKADLVTYDAIVTPALSQVNLTYEFKGAVVRLTLDPAGPVDVTSGHYLTLNVTARDAGDHVVDLPALVWTTTNPNSLLYQSNGTLRAGDSGNYSVTVVVAGNPSISARVDVRVLPASNPTGPTDTNPLAGAGLWPWTVLLAVSVAAAALAAYEVVVRSMFAIDDVFLISKDGRLMMHNTRRMRADRDEDILSGMLAAIMSFLRDQDPEENGELKRFQVGGKTTVIERGKSAYLAAVYSGRVPRWAAKDLHRFMEDLDAKFGDAFRSWRGAPEDLKELKELTGRFARTVRYRRGRFRSGAS